MVSRIEIVFLVIYPYFFNNNFSYLIRVCLDAGGFVVGRYKLFTSYATDLMYKGG